MSRRSLGTLTVDIVAQTGGFVQGMTKAERETDRWRRQVEKNMKAGRAAVDRALVGIATAAVGAAAAIAAITRAGAQEISSQAELARSLNTTYDSVTALQEAFRDGGIDNFESSVNRLNRRLGAAELGRGSAFNAVKELGLDLRELASVEADERLAIIADRIKEVSTNSQVAARYAQDLGFEQREAAQFFMQGGDAIRAYREQVEEFGLALSALDVKNVEDMSAAFDHLQRGSRAFRTQLTAELAPAITLVVDELTELVTGAGDVEEAAESMGNAIIQAAAFAMNSISGLARSFGDLVNLLQAIDEAGKSVAPGIDGNLFLISPPVALWKSIFGDEAKQQRDVGRAFQLVKDAIEEIRDRAEEPLAGDAFLERLAKRQAELREEMARGGTTPGAGGAPGTGEIDAEAQKRQEAIEKEISALERAYKTWGMTASEVKLYDLALQGAEPAQLKYAESVMATVDALEEQDRLNKEAVGIAESLRTEEEAILASYERRRQIILDNTKFTGEAQTELLRRLEEERNEQLLEINGGYWERWLAGAEAALTNFDELGGSVIETFSRSFGSAFESMVFDAQTLEESVLNMAEGMARSVVRALGEMAAQWLAYQAVQLATGKAAQASAATALTANAQVGVLQAGINAYASTAAIPITGPALAPAAMATAMSATEPMAAAVGSLALMGMAHDGIDSVPQTGTWLLEKGERVVTSETSAKLDRKLDMIQPGGGGGITIHAPVTVEAQPGMSAADAQRQGEAVSGAIRATIVSTLEKESRPGGLLWQLYGGGR